MHVHARTSGSAESWQCGEAHRHVLCSVLYHLMVTGVEALHKIRVRETVATDDVLRGEDTFNQDSAVASSAARPTERHKHMI